MKKLIRSTALQIFLAILFTMSLTAQNYVVDRESSNLKWTGAKVVSGSHFGTILFKSGSLNYKDGNVESGEFIVDMNSIACQDLEGPRKERLEGHLKSDDFFGVDKFPLAHLKIGESEIMEDGKLRIEGDLTIKGKTNSVSFDSSVKEDNGTLWFKGTMDIDRSLFDVRYGSGKFFDNLGDKAINDIFTLEFSLLLEN